MLLFTNEFLHNLFPNLFTIYTAIKMACFVKQCKSHSGRKSDCKEEITFHRFPKHEAEKKKWLQLIGKPDATEYNRVCSKHFTSDCFKLKSANIKSRRRLKKNVYPSLFLPQNENSKMDKPSSKVNTRLQSQKKKQSPKVNSRLQSQKKEQSSKVDSRFQSQKKVSSSKVNCRLQSQKKSLNLTEASRACKKHDAIISKLQSQFRKAKEISQQREKKMYTLSKRRLRLIRRIKYLDNTLKNKSKEETMKTCTIEENIETDEEENYQTYYDEDEYFHEKEEYFDIKEEYLEIKEDFDIIKAKIEMHQKHEIEIYTNVEYLDDET